jgi:signal transduction histidine kinase
MSSATNKPRTRSAAWRITLCATLAFTTGAVLVFAFLHAFVADDIQRRSDAWLTGEVQMLAEVAENTPKGELYDRVVAEAAERSSRELPNKLPNGKPVPGGNDPVFFLQTSQQGAPMVWVGPGSGAEFLASIRRLPAVPHRPADLQVAGYAIPFRVAAVTAEDGSTIYLGLSARDQKRVLRVLRVHILVLLGFVVLLGAAIVFGITRKMLGDVRRITEAASRIGKSDLGQRVPATHRKDEVGQLARTLNTMLDRIESSMHQLHTITDSLAHDLRSPLTAVRANLERSLTQPHSDDSVESVAAAIEELDRLTELLTTSLDVAESRADALRLERKPIDLDNAVRRVADLYAPVMADQGLHVELHSDGPVFASCDAGLLHRMLGNLFDNAIKHVPPGATVALRLERRADDALLVVEDDGPGFMPEVAGHLFERRAKGSGSAGHGMGLAFVQAVARSHGGQATAWNRPQGGAHIAITLPLAAAHERAEALTTA